MVCKGTQLHPPCLSHTHTCTHVETLRLGTTSIVSQLGVGRYFCKQGILCMVGTSAGKFTEACLSRIHCLPHVTWVPCMMLLKCCIRVRPALGQGLRGPSIGHSLYFYPPSAPPLTQLGVWSLRQFHKMIGEGSKEIRSGHSLLKVSGTRQHLILTAEGKGSRFILQL